MECKVKLHMYLFSKLLPLNSIKTKFNSSDQIEAFIYCKYNELTHIDILT